MVTNTNGMTEIKKNIALDIFPINVAMLTLHYNSVVEFQGNDQHRGKHAGKMSG